MLKDIKSFFYNYLHLILGRVGGGVVIATLNLLLIVRILNPENYGIYVLFGSVASIVGILTIWTSGSIVRFGREEFITEGSIRKTFWANYSILLPAFILAFLLVFIFRGRLAQYIGMSESYYYLILAFILLSNLSGNVPTAFQAIGRMKRFAYLPLILRGVPFVALIIIYFKSLAVSVELLIGILILAHLCTAVVGIWLLRSYITPICLSREWIKRCLSYSYPMAFAGPAGVVIQNMDQIVIRMFMPLAFVGIYNIAYRIQDRLLMLPLISIGLMFPLMTSLIVEKEEDKIGQYIRNYAPQIAFFWALFVSLFIFFSREILSLFGTDYATAALPLAILLIGIAFRIFIVIESPILSSYGLIKQAAGISIAMAGINLGFDYLLIPQIGISGAAVATVIAYVFGAATRSWVTRNKLKINDFKSYPWLFPALISFVIAVFLSGLLYRVLFSVLMFAFCLIVAKRSAIFNSDSLTILDSIEMPTFVRQTIKRVYSILI